MIGKLGWSGQCSCCNGNKNVKAEEKQQVRQEIEEEVGIYYRKVSFIKPHNKMVIYK